jgi:hypothetical protein
MSSTRDTNKIVTHRSHIYIYIYVCCRGGLTTPFGPRIAILMVPRVTNEKIRQFWTEK